MGIVFINIFDKYLNYEYPIAKHVFPRNVRILQSGSKSLPYENMNSVENDRKTWNDRNYGMKITQVNNTSRLG